MLCRKYYFQFTLTTFHQSVAYLTLTYDIRFLYFKHCNCIHIFSWSHIEGSSKSIRVTPVCISCNTVRAILSVSDNF